MELKDSALPLHKNATAKIRPRIFLEGNFFVDLKPGTPDSPQLDSGDTIAITQTSTPVQLDQVLTSLQSDSREDLQHLLDGLSTRRSTPSRRRARTCRCWRGARPRRSPSTTRSTTSRTAERSTAQVLEALLGTEPNRDIARLIRGTARTATELDRYENQLKDLITNFNDTTAIVRVGVDEPARVDPRAGADAAQRQQRVRLAQRRVPADARVRDRDPARRARDAGDDRGRVPVDRADATR